MLFRKFAIGILGVFVFIAAGCATMGTASLNPDQTAQAFIDRLQAKKRQGAYTLLTRGQAARTSFEEFNEVIEGIEEKMGRITEAESAVMPFHRFADDSSFIPLRVTPQQIKRYVYQLHYQDNASINCDLTIVPEDGEYRIAWFSFWK